MLTGSVHVEQRAQASESYREKNRGVKKSVRKDKRDYTDSLAREAQTAAEKGDTRSVYQITKQLAGGFASRATVVKDKTGSVLMKEEEQLKMWAEHYTEQSRPRGGRWHRGHGLQHRDEPRMNNTSRNREGNQTDEGKQSTWQRQTISRHVEGRFSNKCKDP